MDVAGCSGVGRRTTPAVRRLPLGVLLAIWLVVAGIGAAPDVAFAATATAGAMPLLPVGQHVGLVSFVGLSPEQDARYEERIAEAVAAGLDIGRVLVDWAEIEPEAGRIDRAVLDDQLARVDRRGMPLLLTLGVTDVASYALPADLLRDATVLRRPLDDPAVIGRYTALLDALLPALLDDGRIFVLSVANEPDVLLADRPAAEAAALGRFTRAVAEHVHRHYPGLPVTLTLSPAFVTDELPFLAELVAPVDVLALNWDCLDLTTFLATGPDELPDAFARIAEVAAGREIVFQEVMCASGSDGAAGIGASPERQRNWFAAFFAAMADESAIRAAFVLDAVDWPEELAAVWGDALRAEGYPEAGDRYQEFLASWGLLRLPDLAPKPAWDAFLAALRSVRDARQGATG